MLIFAAIAWLFFTAGHALYLWRRREHMAVTARHIIHLVLDLCLGIDILLWGLAEAGAIKANTLVFAIVGFLYFVAMALLWRKKK